MNANCTNAPLSISQVEAYEANRQAVDELMDYLTHYVEEINGHARISQREPTSDPEKLVRDVIGLKDMIEGVVERARQIRAEL